MLSRIVLSKQLRFATHFFSTWQNVPLAPPDAILGLNESFSKDTNPSKVLLGAGAYRNDSGKVINE